LLETRCSEPSLKHLMNDRSKEFVLMSGNMNTGTSKHMHWTFLQLHTSIYIKMNVCMYVCPVCAPIPFIRLR
jgi:hypothetical protein